MSIYHYYVAEIDLPEVVGACTINGNPGFSTPLTCSDQATYSTAIKTHKFTDTNLILAESDIYKCIERVAETTPRLKAGNGVASRATCSITFRDFAGDPNLTSPALTTSPDIKLQGSFFGKFKERNILANKAVRVKYYRVENGTTTLVRTNHYIATDIKRSTAGSWILICKDVLFKADDEKSQFPRIVTGKLSGDITSGTTSVTMEADIADWTPFADYTAVISNDLLMITNATGTSTSVTLTVARASSITLGSRTILNTPEDHSAGDEVFRGRKFVNADLYDVLVKVFEDSDLSTDDYDGTGIASELDTWLPNIAGSIDAIFYDADDSTSKLDDICSEFMLDIWTDTSVGKIKVKATSPWDTTTAILTESKEITYDTIKIEEPSDIYYSRAFLQYDKRKLTENNDDVNFARSSLAFNTDLEGVNFYDDTKLKRLGKSIILSNKLNNIEAADLTTVRYAQRFSNRPQNIEFQIEEADLNFSLGDVVEIVSEKNQDFWGNAKHGVRAQVVQISPVTDIGRKYNISTITYNPFIGGISGSDLTVNSEFDNNLFTIAGGPVSAGTYTFIFNKPYFGQNTLAQAIAVGSFPSGSILNLVFIGGAIGLGKGGRGGNGKTPSSTAQDGENGGSTLSCTTGVTVNVYLNGTTPDFGNGTHSADGYLYAPGGGGAGGTDIPDNGGDGGGGGAGYLVGVGGVGGPGIGPVDGADGNNGTTSAGGSSVDGGDGGGLGLAGANSIARTGGAAGKALVLNGATVNIYTNGETSRFIQGSGDTPTGIS